MTLMPFDEIIVQEFEAIQERTLNFQPRPAEIEGIPELPMDPTEISDTELMNLFFSFNEWASYAQCTLAWATVQEKAAELELGRVRARVLAGIPAAKTVTAQKNAAALNEEVQEAEAEAFRAYCYRTLLEPIYARAERHAATISREISRRQGRATTERRASKWGT